MKKLTKETIKLWDDFVHKYTPSYVLNEMEKDDYIIGKGPNNKSFCYIVERELSSVGGIRGATASKFGLYYNKDKHDYVPTKRYGENADEAFAKIKIELSSLIERSQKLNRFKDIESIFSGMFKYKIIYLYNPVIMIPSFVEEDLKYFAQKLNLKPQNTYEKLQNQLIDYYLSHPSNKYSSIHEFGCYLYNEFGRNVSSKATKSNAVADNVLKEKVRGLNLKILENFEPSSEPNKFDIKEKQKVYRRDPKCSLKALSNANFRCEYKGDHYCFERRKDSTSYVEAHHLVPMQFQEEFDVNIDIPENIVSLCSNCHNEIHYGKNADVIIVDLFNKRKSLLESKGIYISIEQLLMMYHKTNE